VASPLTSGGWEVANSATCGRPRDGYECRIVDDLDRDVPAGAVGELVVRPTEPWTIMAGYWGMPEKTVEAWRNLWFHTGDAARSDAEGNYYFVDRIKDSIRRRGENISSLEVEHEVGRHPDVLEVAAVGVPSEWGEEEVKIVVVTKPGRTVTEAALATFLEPLLPRYMLPRYIELVDALPKTPTEKVEKRTLRAAGVTATTWDRLPSERR
jgi:crotonobetaine/carnitine-CoA ligase